jgi:hypothetical protein
VSASKIAQTGPSVPICKERIVRHETENFQVIVVERFLKPDRINLQQKDDHPALGVLAMLRLKSLPESARLSGGIG